MNTSSLSCHWPPPAGCGSRCQFDPRRGLWPPRCHTAPRSSGPQRWPSDWPYLWANTHGVTVERLYRLFLPSPAVLSCSVYRGKTASHLLLKPTHYPRCVFLPPRFPSHSPSLIPICCLIIAHGLSPTPTFLPSQPTILHMEDKYRSPLKGEVSDCFVRDTTWLVSTSDCQHSSKGELEERNLTFIRASSPSLLMEADINPLLSGQAELQQQPPVFASSNEDATALSALNTD